MNVLLEQVDGFRNGINLPSAKAEAFLDALINEADEALLSDLFLAWDRKGISADEIFELAQLMRERCTRVGTVHKGFVDIVGTGGSRGKTFNVSTAAAFVVAGAGMPVAKHGNKAATSSSGSADVLSSLGVEPSVDAATAERCLNDIDICFMFAPNFHRLSATLAKVRRDLGFPTIFNCVGPLCNPANVPHQLIGVWRQDLVEKMAHAISRLGTKRSWIVYGRDGVDEISLSDSTLVAEVDNASVRHLQISPEDFGISSETTSRCKADSPEGSADLIRDILEAKQRGSAAERIVLCNAGAALYIAGAAATLTDGFADATESIRSGRAMEKLNQLAAATRG
jgi:anthranilate phosphoribosyltransferase